MLTENKIVQSILKHGPDIIETQIYDKIYDDYLLRLTDEKLNYPTPKENIDIRKWNIPQDYLNIDIEKHLLELCPEENLHQLQKELSLWKLHDMIPVLKTMKYIVDTLRENNIVWGVGRGSSVASYALYLIGIHKIDSIKYKLPIEEFFKEKNNG